MSIENTDIINKDSELVAPLSKFFSTEGVVDLKYIYSLKELWQDYEKGARDNPPNKNQLTEPLGLSRRKIRNATDRLKEDNLIEEKEEGSIGVLRLTKKGRMAYKLIEALFSDIEKIVEAINRIAFGPDSSKNLGEDIEKADVERKLGRTISDDVFRYAEKLHLESLRNNTYEKSEFVEETEEELEEMSEEKSE